MTHVHDNQLSVEITVHRIGGPAHIPNDDSRLSLGVPGRPWERTYGPRICNLNVGGSGWLEEIRGAHNPADSMHIRVYSLGQAEHDGWWSGSLHLSDAYDSPIGGPRPYLFYGRPSDVATHTHFQSPYRGHYVVALRSPAYDAAPDPEPSPAPATMEESVSSAP